MAFRRGRAPLCAVAVLVMVALAAASGVEDAQRELEAARAAGQTTQALSAQQQSALESLRAAIAAGKKIDGHRKAGAKAAVLRGQGAHEAARFRSNTHSAGSGKAKADGEELKACGVCVFVMERIKLGYGAPLPNICVEVFQNSKKADDFRLCHELLAAMSSFGPHIREWFQSGCYKAEEYGAMELIKPCPSHVICSQLAQFSRKGFCAVPTTDYQGNAKEGEELYKE